jgi:glutamate/tyrosine decarboxylase-like PLP-dependent enzyme
MPPTPRHRVWSAFADEVDRFYDGIRELPVQAGADVEAAYAEVARRFPLDGPRDLEGLVRDAAAFLRSHGTHVTHPRYFGLFNPAVRESAIAGDALAALVNPQVAVRSHAAGAAAAERHVLATLGALVAFPDAAGASFTGGGAEANLCAVAAALARAFPEHATEGVAALPARPTLYVSAEAHDSFLKIARLTGLGTSAVRRVATDARLRMDPAALAAAVASDRAAGRAPLLVVGTAGTTAGGFVDPLPELAEVAAREGLWFHVDAAWGGLAALSPRLRPILAGVERADSLTWDAHKTLAVPMAAGMFFCRHPGALATAFGVQTSYMPVAGVPPEPFTTTPQWSRRAIGLKVLLALAETGLAGAAAEAERQVAVGRALKVKLADAGYRVVNETPLPIACFTPASGASREDLQAAAARVQRRGRAWISFAVVGDRPVLRACVCGFRTEERDVDALVEELAAAA